MPQLHREDPEILRAALVGLQHSLGVIEQRITELRAQLGGHPATAPAATQSAASGGSKRSLSASARQRIALAQKKRWAAYKAEHATPAAGKKTAPKAAKRELSAEGRARIVAATKKRWAAFRKAQQAAKAPAARAVKKAAPKKAPAAPPAAMAAPAAE